MPSASNAVSEESSDAEFLRSVQAGELEAFAPLVRRHLPTLRAFVALKLPVPHLADEIAHETFVFAFRHIAEFDCRHPFRPWLRAIAWNLVRKELLRFAREQVNLSRFEQAQLTEWSRKAGDATARDEAIYLEECLEQLPASARRLVEERYRRGLTSEELASAFGRSVEWVRVTLFRVRKQLRGCIEIKLARSSDVA
jgi:RNA polymerase sigma-70 factor, ECF subfamily